MATTLMTTRLFGIDGMSCGACARGLEHRIRQMTGVDQASVHYLTASMLVRWTDEVTDMTAIAERVRQSGYQLVPESRPELTAARLQRDFDLVARRLAVAVFFGMWSMAAAIALYAMPQGDATVSRALALGSGLLAMPVVAYAGADIVAMAWKSLRLGDLGIDLLVTLGVLGSVLLSISHLLTGSTSVYFDTATMLITLLLVGRLIDLWVRKGAVAAITAMDAASPDLANRVTENGSVEFVPAASLVVGDTVAVEAGSTSSVDGVVLTGFSSVNRAALTGESRVADVGPGERVEAGTTNLTRRLQLRVDRDPGDRDIDRMGGRIAVEIARRGHDFTRTDLWARRLSIAIPALAFVVGVATFLAGLGFEVAASRALTLLVGACPCALALAAPLAQVRATLAAARFGVRIQDPVGFMRLAEVKDAIFDKTGTLTIGMPGVISIKASDGWSEQEVLAMAAHAETGIDHPLARSIIRAHGSEMGEGGTRWDRGASAVTPDGAVISVASAQNTSDPSGTVLQVLRDNELVGHILVDDPIDPSASAAIGALSSLGIVCSIATGDNANPAHRVAEAVGISSGRVHSGCTPAEKADLVRAAGSPVLFIGDGINDGPALAASACGLSVRSAHASASSTAHVAIVDEGIRAIAPLVRLSRRTVATVNENIVLATVYNVVLVPLAATGMMTPLTAALAMLFSSLSVLLNTWRLGLSARPRAAISALGNVMRH